MSEIAKVNDAMELLKKPYGRLVIPDDDGTYRAEMMEFPGCIAIGDTAPEALSNLENVAESWLETALANGQSIPEPMDNVDFSGRLVLRLPKSLHQRAAYAADRDGVSLNQFIVGALAIQVGAAEARQFTGANFVIISGTNFVQNNLAMTTAQGGSSAYPPQIGNYYTLTMDNLAFSPGSTEVTTIGSGIIAASGTGTLSLTESGTGKETAIMATARTRQLRHG
jgi:predicted RNase H-like HicB family nuclease